MIEIELVRRGLVLLACNFMYENKEWSWKIKLKRVHYPISQ